MAKFQSKKFGYLSGTCVHEHISPLLGKHPRIVNIILGPVTVHYREVSLYWFSVTNNVHCGMAQAKLTWITLRLRREIIIILLCKHDFGMHTCKTCSHVML